MVTTVVILDLSYNVTGSPKKNYLSLFTYYDVENNNKNTHTHARNVFGLLEALNN